MNEKNSPRRMIKIGIDVGGTFTHAVAIDASTLAIVGKAMVPTTHFAKEGVARGVLESLEKLLETSGIEKDEISIIAHSTTQATNALLEGDVAPVGIIALGKGLAGWFARRQTRLGSIELAPGRYLVTHHCYIDTGRGLTEEKIIAAARELAEKGADVFVASEVFGPDSGENEMMVVNVLRKKGYLAEAASEISRIYGLRVRTRTAVLNASMLPKMLETALMTEKSIRESGIKAPLMIMRSDGGIMDVDGMRRRPILTMLSGPAAGLAAALMYVKISDGIFLEVGGTSTDISLIKNGRPLMKNAEIGGHRLHIRTLDVRTVGVGGGSMVRVWGGGKRADGEKNLVFRDVGPRSAHIAGLSYPAFAGEEKLDGTFSVETVEPRPGDPEDYLAVSYFPKNVETDRDGGDGGPDRYAGDCGGSDNLTGLPEDDPPDKWAKNDRSVCHSPGNGSKTKYAFTATDAAFCLGFVKRFKIVKRSFYERFMKFLSEKFGMDEKSLSRMVLKRACDKVNEVVRRFMKEYSIEPELISYVGGGGGAEVIVPPAADEMKVPCSISENAEVISAIGAALGMIKDSIEKSVLSPSEADILKIRSEAFESVIRMGASPETVEVHVEVDSKQKRIIATAVGAPEFRQRDLTDIEKSQEQLLEIAARSCGVEVASIVPVGSTGVYHVFQARKNEKYFFNLLSRERMPVRVIDREGIIRLKLRDAVLRTGTVATIAGLLDEVFEELTLYGDAGGLYPEIFCIVSGRIIDLSRLISKEQILSLLRVELEKFSREETVIVLVARR